MPSASLHLTHVELLARDSSLPVEIRRAMEKEVVFARLGAVFPDLPFYTNIVTMMVGYWLEMSAQRCPFARKLHRDRPDRFAWHLLGKASRSSELLSLEQRLAFLGGYFSHVALDLELHPIVNWCARRDLLLYGGNESHHHRLTEKYHSLFFHRELYGKDVIGQHRFFTEKTRIIEKPPFFRKNLGPTVRWCADVLEGFFREDAPTVEEFGVWVRSFRHFGFVVSLPIVQSNSERLGNETNFARYYENSDFSFIDAWERGYDRSVEMIRLAYRAIDSGDFGDEARDVFLREADITDLSDPPSRVQLPPLPQPQNLDSVEARSSTG